jgi:UDP:flavonoid glycosyltransferase YjiC (YdhE family)
MRVFILALGTRGDVELFLILGRELARRGHEVTLGSSAFHEDRVRAASLGWAAVAGGTLAEAVAVVRSLATIPDRTQRTYQFFDRWLRPQIAEAVPVVTRIAAGADYFLSNLKMMLRRADGAVVPGAAVTYDPPANLADLARYGTQKQGGRVLDLVAMSRPLVDPAGAWEPSYKFTGFWVDDRRSEWSPPEGLAKFLAEGEPPVIVTMGSMAMLDADGPVLAEALRRTGRRGVVVGGWSGVEPGLSRSGPIYRVGEVPYDWLFQRGCCILHHGGCGTVGYALRSGRPSIVWPQITAQEHFARALLRERLATAAFDEPPTPEALAGAIARAVEDEEVRTAALAWQRVVTAEPGVAGAADLIESHGSGLDRG